MNASPRTYLFVPGARPERFDKALSSGADCVVLDLEDAVSPDAKAEARDAVAQRLRSASQAEGQRLVVRINDEGSEWFAADLAMLRACGAAAVMLPKAEKVETIVALRVACAQIAVLALLETARGVLNAHAIALSPGVQRLVFGTIDFALDMNLSGDPVGFDYAAGRLALASRAAGIDSPVAGVTAAINDEAALLADVQRARAHGFGAKLCIHPEQVAPIHAALQPSESELVWARRVVLAAQSGPGAVQLDGRMVDKPVVLRAQALLARQERQAG